jgi:hypothetical protein
MITIDGLNGFVNRQGKIVIAPSFECASDFSDGYAAVERDGEFGFINLEGEFAIDPHFTFAGRFHQGLCLVTTKAEIGYINREGDFVWRGPLVANPLGSDLRL